MKPKKQQIEHVFHTNETEKNTHTLNATSCSKIQVKEIKEINLIKTNKSFYKVDYLRKPKNIDIIVDMSFYVIFSHLTNESKKKTRRSVDVMIETSEFFIIVYFMLVFL